MRIWKYWSSAVFTIFVFIAISLIINSCSNRGTTDLADEIYNAAIVGDINEIEYILAKNPKLINFRD